MKMQAPTHAPPRARAAADRQFAAWLARHRPEVYKAAAARIAKPYRRAGGLGDATINSVGAPVAFGGWADTVREIMTGVIQYKTTDKLLDAQLTRAQQGLPPLDAAQYAPTVKVDLDYGAAYGAAGAALGQYKLPLLIGAGVLAWFMLK